MKYKISSTKANKNSKNKNSKMEVIIMNIFRTKVREMKAVYKKVTEITILGQKFELQVAYKNIKVTELNFENKEVKVLLPLKFKNKDIGKILNIILDKMYEQIAKNETEAIMEKIRTKLKFAPEDYKIVFMKNSMAKCNNQTEIVINPYIMRYDLPTVEYIILHEYCHLKYKTHSKGFWELIKKAMPKYEEFAYAA